MPMQKWITLLCTSISVSGLYTEILPRGEDEFRVWKKEGGGRSSIVSGGATHTITLACKMLIVRLKFLVTALMTLKIFLCLL